MPEASDVAWVTSTFGRAHQRQLKAAAIINKMTTPTTDVAQRPRPVSRSRMHVRDAKMPRSERARTYARST